MSILSMPSLDEKWKLIELSTQYSNSHSSRSLRLEHRSYARTSEWGEAMRFAVGYGETTTMRGMFDHLDAKGGQIINNTV